MSNHRLTLPYYRPHPRWFVWLLPFLKNTAFAWYPSIFLPYPLFQRYQANSLSMLDQALCKHEETHWHRQQSYGTIGFILHYLFSPTFRLSEELVAIQSQMQFCKSHHVPFPIQEYARVLSGWRYGWMISHTAAQVELERVHSSLHTLDPKRYNLA